MRRGLGVVAVAVAGALIAAVTACSGDDEGAPVVAEFETSSTNPVSGQLGAGDDNDDISPFRCAPATRRDQRTMKLSSARVGQRKLSGGFTDWAQALRIALGAARARM